MRWTHGALLSQPVNDLITPPALEPLDLGEVKKQRRFSGDSMDTLFDTWIAASRQYFEEETGYQLMTAVWESAFDTYPVGGVIELPHPPLQAVLSISSDDGAGGETVLDPASYTVFAPQGPYARRGRVRLASGSSWPGVTTGSGAVRVRYRAGFGNTPSEVPELVKVALMYLVGLYHRFAEELQELKGNSTLAPVSHGAKDIMFAWKMSGLPTLKMQTGGVTWPG